ncbi:MAG: 1-acyl-sn-glycerol-3-phosphate acyltransferase [Bacteroidales bacterium]|nr:1-acyl-sn-glycerol-3-phosphate acyltransferase [Bacteroidales bacterium]
MEKKSKTAAFFLKILRWKIGEDTPAPEPKVIILGVPHTSIIDFVISWLYYRAIGGKPYIMVKQEFFRWPIKRLLKSMGGIPVDRSIKGGAALIKATVNEFNSRETFHVCISPEGTRKAVNRWKKGFHRIAMEAGIPVYTGYFDFKTRTIGRGESFPLTGDADADIANIRRWYKEKGVVGCHPNRFAHIED